MKTSPRTINHFTGTDGKQFYAFEGKGFDQAHPKSNPTHMDKRNYRMNIFNGRLYEGNFYQSLDRLSDDDWDGIRDMIRSSNDADKAKRSV